jgi:hypothetical protein
MNAIPQAPLGLYVLALTLVLSLLVSALVGLAIKDQPRRGDRRGLRPQAGSDHGGATHGCAN